MHSEFRFPKSATILMSLILGGVLLAIEKAEIIIHSTSHNGLLPPAHPPSVSFLGAFAMLFAVVYAGAIAVWAVLFMLRRSGVHRLSALDPVAGQK